jgi:hypothetical protein
MPTYVFKNPDKEEYVEVVQKMSDDHVFMDSEGVEWERVWTSPAATMGMNSSPDSEGQFVDKTKGWNVGDMWDYSKELSDKRKSKRGFDNVGEAHEKKRQAEIDSYKPSKKKKNN